MPINSKRIAKNTVMLYIRMLLMMAVTLYTSRIILEALGVDDYGIYNLVAGFITLFSFISNALTNAIQRYLNVAIGKRDNDLFRSIFSTSIIIFVLLSIVIVVIAETIGLWFVNTQLNVANERMIAVNWVFQFSVLVFVFNMVRSPYNAAIIAHEKMDFYAVVSVGEVLLRLGVVFLLQLFDLDKLILYSVLYFVTIVVINIVYHIYCVRKFEACRFRFIWDRKMFKELLSFSGWSLLGQTAVVGRTQGENFLINHYHSVSANAAQGVSHQVNGAVNQFVSNFQTAFNPQLVQTYATGEMQEHIKLLCRACKFSYYLLLMLVIPTVSNLDVLLSTWLTVVPQYSKEFCLYGLCSYLLLSLSSPMSTTIFANGNIRNYQISLMAANIIGLILSFIALKMGLAPYSTALVSVIVQLIILVLRFYYCHKVCPIGIMYFLKTVIVPLIIVSTLSLVIPLVLYRFDFNIWETLGICFIDLTWIACIVYFLGLNKTEKLFVNDIVSKLITKQQ